VPQIETVGEYFHKEAERFDSIYHEDKSSLEKLIDNLFRGVVRKRYELTMARMGSMNGERILDVGCGSGRYGISAALNGAGEIVGIDMAENMLNLAREYAKDAGVEAKCKWIKGEFLNNNEISGKFNFILAMGFFDYISDPEPFVSKMGELLDGTLIASFPKRWEVRNFIRKIRLTFFGCGVRYYTINEINQLFSRAGLDTQKLEIKNLSRDYLVYYSSGKGG
jgi:2-polyprenyl-3-methyl-5-hydroxy-6-metoxy-1,4-benzoquinol methylase